MDRYKKGKIYKIVDVGFNKCYYGSTTEPLSKRMERHRKSYKQFLETGKLDTTARVLFGEFGVDNCTILLVEDYPCENKEQLLSREGEHIKNNECVNKQVAGRTHKEYQDEYSEYFKNKKKEYYKNHREDIISKNKQYIEDHKEEIQKYRKQRYEANKGTILAKQARPFTCECGATCVWNVRARHFRSMKHQLLLEQQKQD